MKRIALLLAVVAFSSCKQEKPETAGAQPYFVFDKVDYYHKDVTSAHIDSLYLETDKSRKDLGLMQIVTGNVPVNPVDTLFVANMSILEFSKKELPVSDNQKLSDIFSLKTDEAATEEPNCKPIYRDVLVFREKGRVVGVAKISFDCKKQQMVGMRYNPKGFGTNGEFEELKTVLGAP